ncbi:MAG: multiphosphoryl transfer protein [Gaiellaceae bacterium]|nr:multiphosphoryl transfer protein [Gaiellaceae bacterium]
MSTLELRGLAASGGIAIGRALHWREPAGDADGDAVAALAAAAEELGRAAERLHAQGLVEEAEILDVNRLMAEDPSLVAEVERLARELPAAEALRRATAKHADLLAALHDEVLAARATDVRQLGLRAARALGGAGPPVPAGASVLVAHDLGPAEVAELDLGEGAIEGIALAEGAATSHAAIIARSLGIPLVVGIGEGLLGVEDGARVVLEGDEGRLLVEPSPYRLAHAEQDLRARRQRRSELASTRTLPAVTRDGRAIRLLCNACTPAEVAAGLAAGAEGVGLLRTELAFLAAPAWPSEGQHVSVLAPALRLLEGRVATVRTLDFGADKTPPFLAGIQQRGLALMLAHPDALAAQLRAIVAAGSGTDLRILLPLVEYAADVHAVRALVGRGVTLGAMIETPTAAGRAAEIAAAADFISIGTNDLVQYTLGLDRDRPVASATTATEPVILRLIGQIVSAAHAAGKTVEVCGEAAGEPEVAELLVGLGVDELSVSPARLDEVRAAVRALSAADATEAARLAQLRDESGEVVGGRGGVGA